MKTNLTRRGFFGTAAAGVCALPVLSATVQEVVPAGQFKEEAKLLPVKDEVDVIVCGGGPAGFAAAISAARAGAKTRLFEMHGCLGGIWTTGSLSWILGGRSSGIGKELAERLDVLGARVKQPSTYTYACDPEVLKLVLEEMCEEAGVRIRLHTAVRSVCRDGRRVTGVITESKSGREVWKAKQFVDATGDGDVGALAGCGYEMGIEGRNGLCQPMSLNALLYMKDAEAIKKHLVDETSKADLSQRFRSKTVKFREEIKRGCGEYPSYAQPSIFYLDNHFGLAMFNHEYQVRADNAEDITRATMQARKEMHRIVDGLRKLGGVWEDLKIVSIGEQIGIREGRRIEGLAKVTFEDLMAGIKPSDTVVVTGAGCDVHQLVADKEKSPSLKRGKVKPYGVPLRALIAKDVDGLMMAGRCISGDFYAHSSYRLTGTAAALGEVAGKTCALAAKNGCLPQGVPVDDVNDR